MKPRVYCDVEALEKLVSEGKVELLREKFGEVETGSVSFHMARFLALRENHKSRKSLDEGRNVGWLKTLYPSEVGAKEEFRELTRQMRPTDAETLIFGRMANILLVGDSPDEVRIKSKGKVLRVSKIIR